MTLVRVALPFLILDLLAAAGCSHASSARTVAMTVTPELVRQHVRNNELRVHSLKGEGSITVESPEMSQSGSFKLMLRKPDSVFVKLEGPFGIDVAAALLTRREFWFYSSIQNRLITGSMNPSNLKRILRVDATFDELVDLLTGGTFFSGDEREPEMFTTEDDRLVLTYTRSSGSRRYWIDASSLLIVKVVDMDARGKPVVERRFGNFRSVEGTSLPHNLRLLLPQERRALSIAFSSLTINSDELDFSLDVPENAERIPLQ